MNIEIFSSAKRQTLYSLIHSSFLFVSFSLSRTLVYCVWYVLPVLHLMLMLLLLSRHVERHGTVPISALLYFAKANPLFLFPLTWLDLIILHSIKLIFALFPSLFLFVLSLLGQLILLVVSHGCRSQHYIHRSASYSLQKCET